MHIHILHTLNRVLHPIIQPTTKNMERIAIEQIPAPVSLKPGIFAQAKEVFRSSYKPSLRRDCQQRALQVSRVLAWTSPPRLSETAIRSKVRSLPRVLAEARPSRLSEIPHHSKWKLPACARARAGTKVKLCYSRLGEMSSLGQKYQISPLFKHASTCISYQITFQGIPYNHSSTQAI